MEMKRLKKQEDKNNKEIKGKKLKPAVIGIVSVVVIIIAVIIGFSIKVQNVSDEIDIYSYFEESVVYDADGEIYAEVSLNTAYEWIKTDDIYDSHEEIFDKETCAKILAETLSGYYDYNEFFIEKALLSKYNETELKEVLYNTMYFGNGVFGISNAAKYYFSKEYDSLTEKNIECLKEIIIALKEENETDDIVLKNRLELNEGVQIYEKDDYVDAVIKDVADAFMTDGIDEKNAYKKIYGEGLKIYSYADKEIQNTLVQKYNEKATFTKDQSDNEYVQSGMIVMDYNGCVRAIAGGNAGDKIKNRAVSETYQVGSTIKPVSIYSLALEKGIINFSSLIFDKPKTIKGEDGNDKDWPTNADGMYEGQITVTEALQKSKNTVAVNIGDMIGETEIYKYLHDTLEYDTMVSNEGGNSDLNMAALAMGYFYDGITLEKLTSSFEMFGNGGIYYGSTTFSKVVDRDEETVLECELTGKQVLSSENATIMNRLLQNNVYGKDGIADKAKIEGMTVAGKTGTVALEDENSSKLFVGMTPEYIAGVWVGVDNNSGLKYRSYYEAIEIWQNIMSGIGHDKTDFEYDENVLQKDYCVESGALANEKCREIYTGYYTDSNMPDYCSQCE